MHKEFESRKLNAAGALKVVVTREAFDALLSALVQINPSTSREMSIVRTKLEEASFFAVKAIAQNPEYQDK